MRSVKRGSLALRSHTAMVPLPVPAMTSFFWFDRVFRWADGPGQWAKAKLARYCDDFVVMARYISEDLPEFMAWAFMHDWCAKARASGIR